MRYAAITLLALVSLALPARAGASIEEAVADLASPYLEIRRSAARRLVREGPAGRTALIEAYPRSDFRTKTLILDAFAERRPAEGLPLVRGDLGTLDRGVALAQGRLVSAVYRVPVRIVAAQIGELLGEREWELQEHLRALPGPAPSARAALRAAADSDRVWLRDEAWLVRELVRGVDAMRRDFEREARGLGPPARNARRLVERIRRHDVERAFLAVLEAGGLGGNYEGLFATVGELLATPSGPSVIAVLLAIARDESMPGGHKGSYAFLEEPPPQLSAERLRRQAVECIGDVGDAAAATELSSLFRSLLFRDPQDGKTTLKLDVSEVFDEKTSLTLTIAHACAGLGEDRPILMVIDELRKLLGERSWSTDHRSALAHAYSTLGRLDDAAREFREILDQMGQFSRFRLGLVDEEIVSYNLACALSRNGKTDEALAALRKAVEGGYGRFDRRDALWMDRDLDLVAVRETEGYAALRRELLGR